MRRKTKIVSGWLWATALVLVVAWNFPATPQQPYRPKVGFAETEAGMRYSNPFAGFDLTLPQGWNLYDGEQQGTTIALFYSPAQDVLLDVNREAWTVSIEAYRDNLLQVLRGSLQSLEVVRDEPWTVGERQGRVVELVGVATTQNGEERTGFHLALVPTGADEVTRFMAWSNASLAGEVRTLFRTVIDSYRPGPRTMPRMTAEPPEDGTKN